MRTLLADACRELAFRNLPPRSATLSETRVAELDAALPGLARKIRALEAIAWPDGIEERFLSDWRAGRPELPAVPWKRRDHGAEIEALETLAGQCDTGHPAGVFLAATAHSYTCAGRMSAGDVVRLAPLFESGWLEQPRFVPPWASDLRRLAAALAFFAFVGRIKLEAVSLERFVELEEE